MSDKFSITKQRMEALTDGVFGVAMTILILEVKVPDIANRADVGALLQVFRQNADMVITYFLSFAMLGLFWIWHHRLASKVRAINLPLLLWSLTFLAFICMFPFAAAVFGRYVLAGNVAGLLIYLPTVFFILFSQTMYFRTAMNMGLLNDDIPLRERRSAHRHNLLWTGLFTLSCVPAAMAAGRTAIAGVAAIAIALLWRAFVWR